jgi:hypothetical protein
MTKLLVAAVLMVASAISYTAGSSIGSSGSGFQYFDTQVSLGGNREDSRTFTCPKSYTAISGYWRSNAVGLLSDYNSPDTNNRSNWTVGIYNLNSKKESATIGVVCAHR